MLVPRVHASTQVENTIAKGSQCLFQSCYIKFPLKILRDSPPNA